MSDPAGLKDDRPQLQDNPAKHPSQIELASEEDIRNRNRPTNVGSNLQHSTMDSIMIDIQDVVMVSKLSSVTTIFQALRMRSCNF